MFKIVDYDRLINMFYFWLYGVINNLLEFVDRR